MDNTVIRPFQELLIDSFNQLLAINDITLNLYFITLQPLEFTDVDPEIQDDEEIEEETGIKQDDKQELSFEDSDVILGSLKNSGHKLGDDYEFVAEMDENDKISSKDFADYLIEENPSTLSKIRKLIGLKEATEDNVGSIRDGSAFSYLDSTNGLYKIRYKYARGMKKTGESRQFCTEMMRLSDSGLVWRIEDIDRASYPGSKDPDVNIEFRHKENIPYDIFKLKGGIYCQHKWVRLLYRLKKRTKVKSENLNNYMVARNKNEIPKYMINRKPRGTKESEIPTDKQLPGRGAYPK